MKNLIFIIALLSSCCIERQRWNCPDERRTEMAQWVERCVGDKGTLRLDSCMDAGHRLFCKLETVK